ncbi:winged helix-turn-helix transcriptional regulator [Paenibacillus chitinolyticus]|uniref:winged helix-turn-helix transcriptional regulator n=1 Tax=Paenibacillus chitinolyticus TaxID=79263 RepID=UPI00295EDEB3|nr:winged helix-turn-helix transcriptional regulator [Paenibacillus chitinolyticus]
MSLRTHRPASAGFPPKVEYSITEYGMSLSPILETLHHWGVDHIERKQHITEKNKQTETD